MGESVEQLHAEIVRLKERIRALEGSFIDPNLRRIAAQIPDNIMLIDREERIRFINWTVPDLTIEQVLGTQPYDYIPPSQVERTRAAYRAVIETGEPQRLDIEYEAEDGSSSHWETRATPVLRGGEIAGAVVISTNVTERHKAADDLDRFFRLSVDLLCVIGKDGVFCRVNHAFTELFGFSEHELTADTVLGFIHEDDRQATRRQFEQLWEGHQVIDFENRFRCKSGGYKTLQWRATAPPKMGRIYAAARDVSERNELEMQLRQSQKMQAVGQLAGGIAHDFNNLLLAIKMNTDFATRHAQERRALDHLAEAKRNVERAADLTGQLLTFSRKQPLKLNPVDPRLLVEGIVKMVRRTIAKNIELALTKRVAALHVNADKGQLEQVLLNLCLNARDALPGGGRIDIEIEQVLLDERYSGTHPWAGPGQYVLISVTDNGTGMPPETCERIFEPFFTTKPIGQGTGLGLATAYGIVQQHNGMLHVSSEVGEGTTFKLYLPILPQPVNTAQSEHPELGAPGGSETILVAEDDDAVREVVLMVLEDAGYSVLEARNGLEAVELAQKHGEAISLAMLDVVMPKMSGPQAATVLGEQYGAIRILFTSGYSDHSHIGPMAKHIQVVTKPYEIDELLRQVRTALDADSPAAIKPAPPADG